MTNIKEKQKLSKRRFQSANRSIICSLDFLQSYLNVQPRETVVISVPILEEMVTNARDGGKGVNISYTNLHQRYNNLRQDYDDLVGECSNLLIESGAKIHTPKIEVMV